MQERIVLDGCDGCGDGDGGDRGRSERAHRDDLEFAVFSEGDGCKVGTLIERATPDGYDGCGDLDGGERGILERAGPDLRPPRRVTVRQNGIRWAPRIRIVACTKETRACDLVTPNGRCRCRTKECSSSR